MDVKTFRAPSMQEALAIVRRELGSGASVLSTRAITPGGLMRLLGGERMIEVVASATISAPSRLPALRRSKTTAAPAAKRRLEPLGGIDLSRLAKGAFSASGDSDASSEEC